VCFKGGLENTELAVSDTYVCNYVCVWVRESACA